MTTGVPTAQPWLLEERVGVGDTEFREDPHHPAQAVIITPQLKDGLAESQTSKQGTPVIDMYGNPVIYNHDGCRVRVVTPAQPLLHLEEHQRGLAAVGVYDRSPGLGAVEDFLVEGSFGPMSIELLINAFIDRTKELSTRAFISKSTGNPQDGNFSLRQFVVYGTYGVNDTSLVGKLLASQEIAPTVQSEISQWANYHQLGGLAKCLNCEIAKQERQGTGDESRVILYHDARVYAPADTMDHRRLERDDGAISFINWAPKDTHHVQIVPFQHTSRLTELSNEQIKYLAELLYKCIRSIGIDAQRVGRGMQTLEFAFHSLPFFGKNDMYLQRNGGPEVGKFYHFYAEILPRERNSYEITGSGWLVVPGERPKETAKRLREILTNN